MLSSTINNLIYDLKPRHREVISSRFGLANNKRETLAGLGERYGITRERVRQIEAEALRKIKEEARKEHLHNILERVSGHLDNLGGVRKEDIFISELKSILEDDGVHHWNLRFLGELTNQPLYYFDDDEFYAFWYLDDKVIKTLRKFVNYLERLIALKKDHLIIHGKFSDYLTQATKKYEVPDFIGINYLSTSRKFKVNPYGDFGLSPWEEIDPKTMGSKAYLVIKKEGEPLHFRKVADIINKVKFDGKKALPQTIHNELIKDPRFVLVGRGIYGLKEQGFKSGTVKEIMVQILKKQGPMTVQQIIDAVLKQRFLEKNTILLNLQNKKLFKRLTDGRYKLAKL